MAATDELELDSPSSFRKRERAFQRLGVVALTLFVIAGAAGAFGNGPLADATQVDGRTALRYERFGRTTAPTAIEISVNTGVADGEPVRFRLERQFVANLDFLELRPSDAFKGFDGEDAMFEVSATNGRGEVELHYKPHRPGVLATNVVPEGAERARLSQLIYF